MITTEEKNVKQLKEDVLDMIMDREFTRKISDEKFLDLLNMFVEYSVLESQNVETIVFEVNQDTFVEGFYRSYASLMEGMKSGFSVYCNQCGVELELKDGMTADPTYITLSHSEINCCCGYSITIDENSLVKLHIPDEDEDILF